LGESWADGFHEFAVERSATAIVFAVDGVVILNSSAYDPPSASAALAAAHKQAQGRRSLRVAAAADRDIAAPAPAPTRLPPAPVDDLLLWPVPFYLILNSAVGGSWPGEPDARTISPTSHVIDYVRVVRAL
jgi:hypothetical protein